MRNAAALILLTTAQAMSQSAILIDIEDDTLLPGQSTTVTLWAAWPEHEYAFARTMTNFETSVGSEGWSDFELIPPMLFVGTTPGEASATGVDGIFAWQNNFPPAGGETDRSNPIDFWRATYTAPLDVSSPMSIDLATRTTEFEVYFRVWEIETHSYLHELAEGSATIHVIPAPACVLGLGIGVGCFSRRRRR